MIWLGEEVRSQSTNRAKIEAGSKLRNDDFWKKVVFKAFSLSLCDGISSRAKLSVDPLTEREGEVARTRTFLSLLDLFQVTFNSTTSNCRYGTR